MQTLRRPASLPLEGSVPWPAPLRSLAAGWSVRVAEGEVLVREGEAAPSWHFLLAGAVSLSCTHSSGRRCVLAILGPGDLLTPASHDLGVLPSLRPDARALVESTMLVIAAHEFEHLVRGDGDVALWLCSILKRQTERFQSAIARAVGLRVHERVLATLLDLALSHGRPTPDGTRISFPLSQETVAFMVGATRESVNRSMKRLEAEGAVRRSGDSYVVLTGCVGQDPADGSR